MHGPVWLEQEKVRIYQHDRDVHRIAPRFNVLSSLQPLGEGSSVLDFEDLIVSNYILPVGAFIFVLFCTARYGWGWENFVKEADEGRGLKVMNWMRPYVTYVLPLIVILVFILGII